MSYNSAEKIIVLKKKRFSLKAITPTSHEDISLDIEVY